MKDSLHVIHETILKPLKFTPFETYFLLVYAVLILRNTSYLQRRPHPHSHALIRFSKKKCLEKDRAVYLSFLNYPNVMTLHHKLKSRDHLPL
jgi:hypothetical protein